MYRSAGPPTFPPAPTTHHPAGRDAFEKARLSYCEQLFEREATRKETLESKAQFYLSLITLILGGIFFEIDLIPSIATAVSETGFAYVLVPVLWGCAGALAVGLLGGLGAVLMAMRLQEYQNEHPRDFITALFAENSSFVPERTEPGLHAALAEAYALGADTNKRINDRKARWVGRISRWLFVAIGGLTGLLILAITVPS